MPFSEEWKREDRWNWREERRQQERTARERQQEFFRDQRQNSREQQRTAREQGEQVREGDRNRAKLLAGSKRGRRTYFWGSTFCLFVLSPLLFFAPVFLASHFGPATWYPILQLFGAFVMPLYALRGYSIWLRSHWYRWIGQGSKG